jgi:hypothetical protein
MDKRYQVFISSTYADLKDERQAVIKTVIEANCIPAGMELFPAADQQQLDFIKRVIDDCDYYILIIGGRYGSVSANGLSYTEQEYDYAMSKRIPVIALLHENPDAIPFGKSEKDQAFREKLEQFRQRVTSNRIVKFWRNATELPGIVSVSLHSEIRRAPGIGWTRADKVENEKLLIQIAQLQGESRALLERAGSAAAENRVLRGRIADLERAPLFPDLASLDEQIEISVSYRLRRISQAATEMIKLTWREVFGYIAPYLVAHPNELSVKHSLLEVLKTRIRSHDAIYSSEFKIDEQAFKTIGIQLKALGLVDIAYTQTTKGDMALFWTLTRPGQDLMMELRTVRTAAEKK